MSADLAQPAGIGWLQDACWEGRVRERQGKDGAGDLESKDTRIEGEREI